MHDARLVPAAVTPLSVMFDHQIFTTQAYGGISTYHARLAGALPAFGVAPTIVAPVHVSGMLGDLPAGVVRGVRIGGTGPASKVAKRIGRPLGRWAVARARADVHHETNHASVRLAAPSIPVVATIHDMIHELFPELFARTGEAEAKRMSIARADRIICISESTRRDLLRFHPEVAERTTVILHGVDRPRLAAEPAPAHVRPYLLFVGGRLFHKNFAALIGAVAASRVLRAECDIVCTGEPFTAAETGLIADAGLGDRVRVVAAGPEALARLYGRATALVYPSLYEGFGLPPLEAMAAGCPVVCLRTSSLPEVCGDAAEYAEPRDLGSLRAAIEAVALSSDRAAALRTAGTARVAGFSWERCAAATADVYRQLV